MSHTVVEKHETESTNADAKWLAEVGADSFTVVWAHRQTAGRGRSGRRWISTDGNVFWSILLRPEPSWPPFAQLVYVHALAVQATLREAIGDHAGLRLKWPNDVLLDDAKIAGSLIEASGGGSTPNYVVIGTGINVVDSPSGEDLRYPTTSLREAGFEDVHRDHLIPRLSVHLAEQMDHWQREGFEAVRQEYLRSAWRLGETVRVGTTPRREEYREGIYRGIDDTGSLLLEPEGESLVKLPSGDVVLPV